VSNLWNPRHVLLCTKTGTEGNSNDRKEIGAARGRNRLFATAAVAVVALRDQGYPLRGTGYYGPLTLGSVKSFQRKHGITTSGIVGSKTWHALVGSLPPSVTGNGGVQDPDRGLRPGGDDRELMDQLSNMMIRIYPYDQGNLPNSSSYDESWQALVRDSSGATVSTPAASSDRRPGTPSLRSSPSRVTGAADSGATRAGMPGGMPARVDILPAWTGSSARRW
jgi:hypothetical protein